MFKGGKKSISLTHCGASLVAQLVKKEFACNAGDLGSIPGLGRSPGGEKGHPLQSSGLENSMDCTVHGVTESDRTEKPSLSLTHHHSQKPGALNRLMADGQDDTTCMFHLSEDPTSLRTSKQGSHVAHIPALPLTDELLFTDAFL